MRAEDRAAKAILKQDVNIAVDEAHAAIALLRRVQKEGIMPTDLYSGILEYLEGSENGIQPK